MKKILCFWIFNILFVHLAFANGSSHADLGNLQMGETAEFQIELYNEGEDDLIFHFFYTSGFPQLKLLSDLPLTLLPGDSANVRMSFVPNKPGDFNEFIRFDNGYHISVTAVVEKIYPEVSMKLDGVKNFGYVGEELELVLFVENSGKVAIEEFSVQEYYTNVRVDLGKIGIGEVVSHKFPYTVIQKDVDQGNIIFNLIGGTENGYLFNTIKGLYLERVPAISILKISDIAEAIIMENHPYEISIQNIGTEILTISKINNDVVGLEGYTELPLDIQPGSISSLMFNFRPDQYKDINEKLVIINNSVNEPEVEIPFNVQPKYGPGEWEVNITIDKEYFLYEGEELNFSIEVTNTGAYFNEIRGREIHSGKQLILPYLYSESSAHTSFTYLVTQNDISRGSILFEIETFDPNEQKNYSVKEIKLRPSSNIAITSDPTFFEEVGEEVRFDIAFEHSGGLFIMEAYYLWDIIPVKKIEMGWIINHTITEEDIERGAVEIRVNVTDDYGFSVQEIYSLPYIPRENDPGDGAQSDPENEEDIEEGEEEDESEENSEEEPGDKEDDPNYNGDNKEDPAEKPNEVNIDHQVFNQSFAPKFYDFAKADQAIVQADGKFIVSGNFIEIDGQEVNGLVRLNLDGTLDTSFKFDFAPITTVRRMEIGPDGNLYVLHGSRVGNGQTLLRLFNDGSVDASFEISLDTEIMEFAILPSGNIVASHFQRMGPGLHMYDADGKKVMGFQVESNTISFSHLAVQGDKILALIPSFDESPATYKVVRLLPDGKFDAAFNSPVRYNRVTHYHQIVVWPNNKFTLYGMLPSGENQLARFMPDGALDNTYANPVFTGNYNIVKYAPADKDELFIIDREDFKEMTLRKLGEQGGQLFNFPQKVLTTYQRSESAQEIIPLALPGGGLLLYGAFSNVGGHNSFGIAKIDKYNHIVQSFNPEILKPGSTQVVKVDQQGRLIVGGNFVKVNAHFANSLARFHANGEVDGSFAANYRKQRKNTVNDLFINNEGDIYVGLNVPWTSADFLHKLNDQGNLIYDFEKEFITISLGWGVTKILPLEGGDFLVGGNFMADRNNLKPQYHLIKIKRDNTIDAGFDVRTHFSHMTRLYTMEISSEKLYTSSYDKDDNYHLKVFDLEGNFLRDSVFYSSSNYSVRAITALPGGKTLISGGPNRQYSENDSFRNFVLDSHGNITEGNFSHRRYLVNDVKVLADSTLLWGGTFSTFNNFNKPYIARTDTLGSVFSFATEVNGPIEKINSIGNEFLGLSGTFTKANGQQRFGFAIISGPKFAPRIVGINGDGRYAQGELVNLGDLLVVIDMGKLFPEGYSFKITGNEVGYIIGDGNIQIEEEFVGRLTFEVQVRDDEKESNIFLVELQVASINRIEILGHRLANEIESNGYLEIKLEDLDLNIDSEEEGKSELVIIIEEGENYTVADGKVIPSKDYHGILNITFRVDVGNIEGIPFTHHVLVREVHIPVVKGSYLESDRYLNEKIFIQIEDLILEENQKMNLEGYFLKIYPGANYAVKGDTVLPADNYKGSIHVGISLIKGELESNVYTVDFYIGVKSLFEPQITRVAMPRIINLNDVIQVTMEDLILDLDLTDQEKAIFKINISDGENFQVNGQSISPRRTFTGKLTIPIYLTASGYMSNVYLWEVTVLDIVIPRISEVKHEKVIPPGKNLRITPEDVVFEEEIPAEQLEFLQIKILPGDHYEVDDDEIIPEKSYEGIITVGIEAEFGKYTTQTAYINFRVSTITGISILENLSNMVSTYPNPTSGELNINVNYPEQGATFIEILNPAGQIIKQYLINKESEKLYHSLELGGLPNGIYILRIRTQDKFAIKMIQKK